MVTQLLFCVTADGPLASRNPSRATWAANSLFHYGLSDLRYDAVRISHNRFIAKADHRITFTAQALRATLISLLIAGLGMMNPVYFHHQALLNAAEIGVVIAGQPVLPAKLHTPDLAAPQPLPQRFFGGRSVAAQAPLIRW